MDQRIDVDGVQYRVRDLGAEGARGTVVFWHGWPDDAELFRLQEPAFLEAGFRVLAPDLPGYGATASPQDLARMEFSALAGDLAVLLDRLGTGKVHLIAHDYGALPGWAFASAFPDRLASFAALSVGHPGTIANASLEERRALWWVFLNQHDLAPQIYRASDGAFFRQFVRSHPDGARIVDEALSKAADEPGSFEAMHRIELGYSLAEMILGAVSRQLPDYPPVRVPTLGLFGEGDHFLAESQMIRSGAFVEAPWDYRRIDGGGHWLMLTQPEAVTAALRDWVLRWS